ncbi:MAG: DUF3025 domain-containing protein [Burkholderiales bacterium]|nr:DUF3025 domain-containing protein [Burkholderiales bacterium]
MAWPSEQLLTSPWFAALRPTLARLAWDQFPSPQDWRALPEALRPSNAMGRPVHFLPPEELAEAGYEQRIFETGMVATRTDNWHDAFNALCWLSWPHAKAALNALHVAELAQQADSLRSRVRDRATLFDESGLVLACVDAHLAKALRGQEWQRLFVEQADEWGRGLQPYLFGHALLEKGLAPYIGVTGRAWVIEVAPAWLAMSETDKIAVLDQQLAQAIAAGDLAHGDTLHPLPILGIPGWWPIQDAAFYADEAHFRPRRHAAYRGSGVVRHG